MPQKNGLSSSIFANLIPTTNLDNIALTTMSLLYVFLLTLGIFFNLSILDLWGLSATTIVKGLIPEFVMIFSELISELIKQPSFNFVHKLVGLL